MAKKQKEITICLHHHGRSHYYTGTVETLTKTFHYTLECGNSWNPKINLHPRTAKQLVSALEKSVCETQGSCLDQNWYELIG